MQDDGGEIGRDRACDSDGHIGFVAMVRANLNAEAESGQIDGVFVAVLQ